MRRIERARLVEQAVGLVAFALADRLADLVEELADVGLGLHPLVRRLDQLAELGIGEDRAALPLGARQQLVVAAGRQELGEAGAEPGCRRGARPGGVGRQIVELEIQVAQVVELRQLRGEMAEVVELAEVRRREGSRGRGRAGGRGGRRLEIGDRDRPGRRPQPLLETARGLEARVHAQHEVTAEERLLAAAVLGQIERLIEGAEEPLLRIGRERGISGIIHFGRRLSGTAHAVVRSRRILAKSLRWDNLRRCYTLPRVPQLECVPNVSEGRRPEVVGRLLRAASAVPGVRLLDASSDPDHNRSVLTLAGAPAALHEGLLALYAAALAEIDLTRHQGVHPRVGAVDVTPFVPLAGAPMSLAVAAAERLGAALAERFGLPVYLYERAARRPERRLLADIRRGGFEGFAAKIARAEWAPDFGPARVHPTAGVTVVGARGFLIAMNAVLATADAEVARAIARRVRESGGGLPALRAIGVALPSRGLAQVSMNLVDYRRTSMWAALQAVRRAAAAAGTEVLETELIGLVPEAAALAVARESLGMPGFGRGRVLERRLDGSIAQEAAGDPKPPEDPDAGPTPAV